VRKAATFCDNNIAIYLHTVNKTFVPHASVFRKDMQTGWSRQQRKGNNVCVTLRHKGELVSGHVTHL